jgi:ATP-binding cassette subfamily C protein
MKKENFRDIIYSILNYKRELILANLIAIFAVLISLPIPMMIPLLIDEILLKKPAFMMEYLTKIIGENREIYLYVLAVLIFVIVLRAIYLTLSSLQSYFFTKISKDITFNLQKRAIDHISRVSLSEYEDFGNGKINSLLVVDMATVDNFLGVTINKFIISILTIIGIGAVLLWINWQLGLFILILMPIIAYITKKIGRKVGEIKRRENKTIASFSDELGESMELFWQIKASNSEKSLKERLINKAQEIKEASIEYKYKSEIAMMFSYFLFLAGFEIFRSAGILSVEYSTLTIGKMLGIFGYLWVIMSPFQEIISIQYAYHTAKAALDRINGIYDMKLEPKYPHKQNPFVGKRTNSVTLKDIHFSYDSKRDILDGINIEAKSGEKIAIVGETGGGKSTIASLIVGFYTPNRGDILYDNISYKEIGLDIIREHVYLTLQSPHLFNDTIRYNLTLGKEVSEEDLKKALKIAQLESFINSLEKGLDEIVGKNGVKLSGGQRQRLSIARMIIADPNIVILDESTSSLDVETEELLFDELSSYLKGRTTIIIAHRLSTITQADRIYLISQGRVIEEGSFQELMNLDKRFAKYIKKGVEC